MLAIPN